MSELWIVEFRRTGTSEWRPVMDQPPYLTEEQATNCFVDGSTTGDYRARLYRRVEPAPGDSGAGEGKR